MESVLGKCNITGTVSHREWADKVQFRSNLNFHAPKSNFSFLFSPKFGLNEYISKPFLTKKFVSKRNLHPLFGKNRFFFNNAKTFRTSKHHFHKTPSLEITNSLETNEKIIHSVEMCETKSLSPANSLKEAIFFVQEELKNLKLNPPPFSSGLLRLQVCLPSGMNSLDWLRAQPDNHIFLPQIYFSARLPRGSLASGVGQNSETGLEGYSGTGSGLDGSGIGSVAALGSSLSFQSDHPFSFDDWNEIRRYLSENSPLVRAYGGLRFDQQSNPSVEWKNFGSFYFNIPQIEFRECEGFNLFSCTLVWDLERKMSFLSSLEKNLKILMQLIPWCKNKEAKIAKKIKSFNHSPNELDWEKNFKKIMAALEESESDTVQYNDFENSKNSNSLSKVVLARKTSIEISESINPLDLLSILKNEDSSAYQFCLQLPSGESFLGNTPERLFVRKKDFVASEAVASTRSRGKTEFIDFLSSIDLMLSVKDHNEFEIVRMSIEKNMQSVCSKVEVEEEKKIIKQSKIQHLYSRINGVLKEERGEYDLLTLLHPTPAVSGQPKNVSMSLITSVEDFDRGFYAGPFGWMGGDGCEFSVAIRSALIPSGDCHVANSEPLIEFENGSSSVNPHEESPHKIILFAGVGIVKGANYLGEWNELNLKIHQFKSIIDNQEQISNSPNINSLWSNLVVEECSRLGLKYFCIAPGSRSSPLAIAAMNNPSVKCIICYDERSLAFHALGYGKGSAKPAVVITSSGTAISNLLPAVVESSMDCIPILLFTADRPHELRDTGANQTIPQANHYGNYVRYHVDLPSPDSTLPARMILTSIDQAVYRTCSEPAGPVHINFPFREPLAPTISEYDKSCLAGLFSWLASSAPYTSYINASNLTQPNPILYHLNQNLNQNHNQIQNQVDSDMLEYGNLFSIAHILNNARRGMMVVGGLHREEESWAAMALARKLQWPIVAEITSGLRILTPGNMQDDKLTVLHYFDHVLLHDDVHSLLRPDVVLQIGSRITSKRISSFLTSSSLYAYILVEDHPYRHDPSHCLTHRIQSSILSFSSSMNDLLQTISYIPPPSLNEYKKTLLFFSEAVGRQISKDLSKESTLSEPLVARIVTSSIPPAGTLFLGNSMAIRDADMYSPPHTPHPHSHSHLPLQTQTHFDLDSISINKGEEEEGFNLLLKDDYYDGVWNKEKEEEEEDIEEEDACGARFGNLSEKVDFDFDFDLIGPRISANRGASGIDGVLSTAVGFAAGSQRAVTLLIGDLSLLHDTNGLSLLKERSNQPPVVIVVINNGGGGIFSLLPVKNTLPDATFTELFSTPHDIEIKDLCRAHRVIYNLVKTKSDLKNALILSWKSKKHTVIEVKTEIKSNVIDHRKLQNSCKQCVEQALQIFLSINKKSFDFSPFSLIITNITFRKFSINLSSPTTVKNENCSKKEGFIIQIFLNNGFSGLGEISPLSGLHKESMEDVEEQILLLSSIFRNVSIPLNVSLLDGSFHLWMSKHLGINKDDLYPSVRCGLEVAILVAMANSFGKSLSEFLLGIDTCENSSHENLPAGSHADSSTAESCGRDRFVGICALMDCNGSQDDVAEEALSYVKKGFTTLKIKVGRRESVDADVAMIQSVRNQVGNQIKIRVDANRAWDFSDAKKFCLGVQNCNLEFIEEPLKNVSEISNLFFVCKIPFALDESFQEIFLNSNLNKSNLSSLNGLHAIVIKPSMVGGLEMAKNISNWAKNNQISTIISSTFESSIGLYAFAEFAYYVDQSYAATWTESTLEHFPSTLSNNIYLPQTDPDKSSTPSTSSTSSLIQSHASETKSNSNSNSNSKFKFHSVHGLGTYAWLKEDTILKNKFTVERIIMQNEKEMGIDLKLSKNVFFKPHFDDSNFGENSSSQNSKSQKLNVFFHEIEIRNSIIRFCIKETNHVNGVEVNQNNQNDKNNNQKNQNEENINQNEENINQDIENINQNDESEENSRSNLPTILFLHGFLGEKDDFSALISSLSLSFRCLSVDLPGHGQTQVTTKSKSKSKTSVGLSSNENCHSHFEEGDEREREKEGEGEGGEGEGEECIKVENESLMDEKNGKEDGEENYSKCNSEVDIWQDESDVAFDDVADAIGKLVYEIVSDECFIVGYSMGARLGLYLSLRFPEKFTSAALISGSPGIEKKNSRAARTARDESLAQSLRNSNLKMFIDHWYSQKMWKSFRKCNGFKEMVEKRIKNGSKFGLAKSLSCMSAGKQTSLWDKIDTCKSKLLLIVGSDDEKFVKIANKMYLNWKGKGKGKGKGEENEKEKEKEREREREREKMNDPMLTSVSSADIFADVEGSTSSFLSFFDAESEGCEDELMTFEKFFANEMRRLEMIEREEEGENGKALVSKKMKIKKVSTDFEQIEVFEVKEAGHAVHFEKPFTVLKQVKSFFNQKIQRRGEE